MTLGWANVSCLGAALFFLSFYQYLPPAALKKLEREDDWFVFQTFEGRFAENTSSLARGFMQCSPNLFKHT